MITAADVNRIFGITESFQLPEKLMHVLADKAEREKAFGEFIAIEPDMSADWFTNYFQEQHSNRDSMMQDFTPKGITDILREIMPDFDTCADICAGTGGLTIAMHEKNLDGLFYCAEKSERAFPLLLFNLSIRNTNAIVVRMDVLTQEVSAVYKLTKSKRFADIEQLEEAPAFTADVVVMNPPYSVKYKFDERLPDARFEMYGFPPSQFADYAFVLHGLRMLKTGGKLGAILPQGLLFRGNKEAAIRERIIKYGQLESVIGLPDNMFLNTGIPVCLMVLNKTGNAKDVLFVDASKRFEKAGKVNTMKPEHIAETVNAYRERKEVPKFAHVASMEEIEYNEYCLNISRFVDTYEPPAEIDIVAVTQDIYDCTAEINRLNVEILHSLDELHSDDARTEVTLRKAVEIWRKMVKQSELPKSDAAHDSRHGEGGE